MFSFMMAKKSKQQHKSDKMEVGCMSGLIRMLDFRRHPKFLSDGRVKRNPKVSEDVYGNTSAVDDKDGWVESIYTNRSSIKTLMEEEMASSAQSLKQAQRNVTEICPEDTDLNLDVSLMEIYRNRGEGQEISNSAELDCTSNFSDKENKSDPGAHLKQTPFSIQKALEDVADAVIRHQSANTKHITKSSEARSKEFVDALKLLSSNKELLLMLIQDPRSRLLECLQNLYMSLGSTMLEPEQYDEENELQGMTTSPEHSVTSPSKVQRRHKSFLEDKLVMRKPPKLNDNSHGVSRIVILKPSPASSHSGLMSSSATSSPLSDHTNLQVQVDSGTYDCHFSLIELKRRLRLAVSNNQKDNRLNSVSSTFGKAEADSSGQLPVASMVVSLASTDISNCDEGEEQSIVDRKIVPECSGSDRGNDVTHGAGSFSYEKAKMYLIERLNDQREDSSQVVYKSESFERLISLPESDSVYPSHCTLEENVSPLHKATTSNLHTIEQQGIPSSSNPACLYQETGSADPGSLGKSTLVELSNEGVEITQDTICNLPLCAESETLCASLGETYPDQCSSEEPPLRIVLPDVTQHSPDHPVNEQDNHDPSEALIGKPSELTFPCCSENTDVTQEKSSLQSVLDSVAGDSTSPRYNAPRRDELSMPISTVLLKEFDTTSESPTEWNGAQVGILDDKDARASFIKAVLEASELLSEENSQRWYKEEPLLDTSVLAEVGTVYCLTDDAVLLFDCVEEVLLRLRDKFFGIVPWVAFLKHNVRFAPVGEKLVQEVVKCTDSLVNNEFPNTLDQVIMKDLENGLWMNLRGDAEIIVIELWDGLLDDLLEEMVFDLWL